MLSILIVADPGVRELLAEELAFDGYTVMNTGDGETAGEIIRFSKPALVILDPLLPGQYRWDLLMNIKKDDPCLPVLIVTDFACHIQDPHLVLADGYLNKDSYVNDSYTGELREKITKMLKEPFYLAGGDRDACRQTSFAGAFGDPKTISMSSH